MMDETEYLSCNCQYSLPDNRICSKCGNKNVGTMDIFEVKNKVWVLGESIFEVNNVSMNDDYSSNWGDIEEISFWCDIEEISLDKPQKDSEPDKCYLVTKNYNPYLLVKLYEYSKPYYPVYALWRNYFLIAELDAFHKIDILTFKSEKYDYERGYFGKFYQLADFLLVTTESRLYCFDKDFAMVWQTDEIACDGVLVHRYNDGYLDVDGENDPPGGWINYKIEFATGKVIERAWAITDDYDGLVKAFEEAPEFMSKQFMKLRKKHQQ